MLTKTQQSAKQVARITANACLLVALLLGTALRSLLLGAHATKRYDDMLHKLLHADPTRRNTRQTVARLIANACLVMALLFSTALRSLLLGAHAQTTNRNDDMLHTLLNADTTQK